METLSLKTQVAIIGGGPSGLLLSQLSRITLITGQWRLSRWYLLQD